LQFAQHLDLLRTFEGFPLETWRLGELSERQRSATSDSQFRAAVVVSLAPLCTISPSNQPSRAPTNAPVSAPRMPNRALTHLTSGYTFRPISSPSRDAAIFFPFNAALSKVFLKSANSVAI